MGYGAGRDWGCWLGVCKHAHTSLTVGYESELEQSGLEHVSRYLRRWASCEEFVCVFVCVLGVVMYVEHGIVATLLALWAY